MINGETEQEQIPEMASVTIQGRRCWGTKHNTVVLCVFVFVCVLFFACGG